MKKIAVHGGNFHADEVFAVAILKLIYSDIKIIRTRDEEKLKEADIRVDVGLKYNPETNDFDHHQKEGAGIRSNDIPYSGAGLIWKHFGKNLASSEEVFEYIDKKIIQPIDANDTGFSTYEVKDLAPYTFPDFIKGFNPSWPDNGEELFEKRFMEAVSIASKVLEREIKKAEGLVKSKEIILKEIEKSNGEYLLLEKFVPWKKTVVTESKDLKYIVYPDFAGRWGVYAVPVSLGSFDNRKDFPTEWAGLSNEALQKVTGVSDAKFCHNNLFIAIAESKEGAIRLAELALKNI